MRARVVARRGHYWELRDARGSDHVLTAPLLALGCPRSPGDEVELLPLPTGPRGAPQLHAFRPDR